MSDFGIMGFGDEEACGAILVDALANSAVVGVDTLCFWWTMCFLELVGTVGGTEDKVGRVDGGL